MLGYLDQPDLTKASVAGGFFKTGDLVRERADGRIELVGRSKEIISRGGNKIAPLEIDDLLASHAEVAAALSAGVPDERLGEAIHAAVVLRPGSRLTADALREWARARTERFKVPDTIHFCDALPLGSTGKAARSAVTAMALADQGDSTALGRAVRSKG
jgi:acyl-CoA synthetase (AMP-forming)/AMP-acid ligase II